MRRLISGLTLALVITATSAASARDIAKAMRAVVEEHGTAVVTLKMVIKENFSLGFLGNDQNESVMETTASLIRPDGLIVTSLSATDPGGMFKEMFESIDMGDLGFEMNFDTQVNEVTIIFPSGDEAPGKIVLRDRDLDLAFIRPEVRPDEPLPFVDMGREASLEQFDRVMVLERMGKIANRSATGHIQRVASVLTTPRLYYVLSDAAIDMPGTGIGLPAFDLKGQFIGMTIMRRLKTGGVSGLSLFGNMESNTALVIVPAADIRDSATQAPGYDEE